MNNKFATSKDIPTLVDCGCITRVWTDESGVEIEYCSMHKAAPELLEACEAAYHSDKYSLPTKTRVALKNAIAAAKGDKL